MPWSLQNCLLLLWAAACAAEALTWEELDEVSLIQLSPEAASAKEESSAIYAAVAAALLDNDTLSHSRHIWKFVTSQPYAPTLRGHGCLYLPSDKAWRSFYEWVEHPDPPLFAEMIENAWDPDCGKSQLAACPEGHARLTYAGACLFVCGSALYTLGSALTLGVTLWLTYFWDDPRRSAFVGGDSASSSFTASWDEISGTVSESNPAAEGIEALWDGIVGLVSEAEVEEDSDYYVSRRTNGDPAPTYFDYKMKQTEEEIESRELESDI